MSKENWKLKESNRGKEKNPFRIIRKIFYFSSNFDGDFPNVCMRLLRFWDIFTFHGNTSVLKFTTCAQFGYITGQNI